MARMGRAAQATQVVTSPDWLPGESVTIRTYCSSAMAEAIRDAQLEVRVDLATGKALDARFNSGAGARAKRRAAIMDWVLFEEQEDGTAGAAIPCTPENVDDMDPRYWAVVEAAITSAWGAWQQWSKGGEKPAARATFQQGDALPAAGQPDGAQGPGAPLP